MSTSMLEVQKKTNGIAFYIRTWRELAILASILMELSWTVLWYRLVISSREKISYFQGLLVLGIMLMGVYLLMRLMGFLQIKLLYRRLVLGLVLVANMLLGLNYLLYSHQRMGFIELLQTPIRGFQDFTQLVPSEFIVMLVVLFVSWRGLSYVDRHIGPSDMLGRFRTGIIMFFAYGVFLPLIDTEVALALYLFLFFGLVALTAARISVLHKMRGGSGNRFDRQWMIGIVLTTLILVGFAALSMGFVGEQLFQLLGNLVSWAIYILVLLLSPLMWLLMRVIFAIGSWINLTAAFRVLLDVIEKLQQFVQNFLGAIQNWIGKLNSHILDDFFQDISRMRQFYLWGSILLLVLVILLTLRRYIMRNEEIDDQEVESLLNQQDLFDMLRDALRRGLGRMADGLDQVLNLRHARRMLAAARIRRIYARLMELSARLDRPRPASKTPLEFLPNLESLFPGLSADLRAITSAYLLVRYGGLPESTHEVETVESAWKRVSAAGQDQLRAQRRKARLAH